MEQSLTDKKIKNIVLTISLAIPIAVAVLIFLPIRPKANFDLKILPLFHAILNSATSILLLISLIAIKNKNIKIHKLSNFLSAFLSAIFLISYVVYHLLAETTKYGDINKDGILDISEKAAVGSFRYIYYIILLTHILLAAIVIPYVLYSFSYALFNQIDKHKKLSKKTWLIWFYVSISGVIVYLMIKNYY